MLTYERNINYWNDIFSKVDINPITSKSIGHDDLDKALDWLCEDSDSILDFGCGSGAWLFKCHLRGTKFNRGIDISKDFFDGVILSNIIDNLIPSDTIKALVEVKRIPKIDGKVLIKLNPFLTDEQIKEW